MKLHRIFCEWYDPQRPNWGGYLNSTGGDFQKLLVEMVEQYGPPTKVEFRADDEGWQEPWVCPDCSKGVVDCHCDEVQCSQCQEWFSAEPDPQGRCPVCVEAPSFIANSDLEIIRLLSEPE